MPTPEQQQLVDRLTAMNPTELELRRRELCASVPKDGTYDDLSVEALEELAFITSTLRKRSSGPPKAAKAPVKAKDINDLLF